MKNILKNKGFTLIELMIAVAIIGVLTSIAYPSYTEYVLRAKRGDGKSGILQVQLAQEKWRANHTSYGAQTDIGIASSPDGHYTIAISGNTATDYIVTATPSHTDASCGNLVMTVTNNNETKSVSGTDSAENCWSK